MDNLRESSWYFDVRLLGFPWRTAGTEKGWITGCLDQYIGGIEHAILHLLYFPIFHPSAQEMRWVNVEEPFTRLLTQGMVCKEVYECSRDGYLYPNEVEGDGENVRCRKCGSPIQAGRLEKIPSRRRMLWTRVLDRKIRGRHGEDVLPLCLTSRKGLDWNDQGVEGSSRFLNRVWRLVYEQHPRLLGVKPLPAGTMVDGDPTSLRQKTHQTIKR